MEQAPNRTRAQWKSSSQAKGTNSTSFLTHEVELVPLACEDEWKFANVYRHRVIADAMVKYGIQVSCKLCDTMKQYIQVIFTKKAISCYTT